MKAAHDATREARQRLFGRMMAAGNYSKTRFVALPPSVLCMLYRRVMGKDADSALLMRRVKEFAAEQ